MLLIIRNGTIGDDLSTDFPCMETSVAKHPINANSKKKHAICLLSLPAENALESTVKYWAKARSFCA